MDINLKGTRTGIDVAVSLNEKLNIPFIYTSSLGDKTTIDLAKATDNEFSDFKWIQFADIFNMTSDYRRPVYEELHGFFITTISAKKEHY